MGKHWSHSQQQQIGSVSLLGASGPFLNTAQDEWIIVGTITCSEAILVVRNKASRGGPILFAYERAASTVLESNFLEQ